MDEKLTANYAKWYNTYLPVLTNAIEHNSDYEYTRKTCTDIPALAHKMTIGLVSGASSKDGSAVKTTCKLLGINHTYKAIKEFITKPLIDLK